MDRSASVAMVVVACDESFPGTGSVVDVEEIAAELVIVAALGTSVFTSTFTVNTADAPSAREAAVQVTVPDASVHPAEAEVKVTVDGSTSVTVNPALSEGPRLVTVSV